jgi:pyruvate ferredoxin oxidoreductase alpha subunit
VETYRCEDAELVLVMIGSFATKAKAAIDGLWAAGQRVGLVRPRLLRPFPAEALRCLLRHRKGVAVIDQNLSPGRGGILHTELAAALYGLPQGGPLLVSFVGGLGGRDIAEGEFVKIVEVLRQATQEGFAPPPRLLFTEEELQQVRRLQAIAHDRNEGEGEEAS